MSESQASFELLQRFNRIAAYNGHLLSGIFLILAVIAFLMLMQAKSSAAYAASLHDISDTQAGSKIDTAYDGRSPFRYGVATAMPRGSDRGAALDEHFSALEELVRRAPPADPPR